MADGRLLFQALGLHSYCTFCDQEYRAVVKHVSTRWLSLEIAVERSLKQLASFDIILQIRK